MFSSFIFVFVAVFIAGCPLCTAQNNFYGVACTSERTGEAGVCQIFNDCASAKEDHKRKISPQVCRYMGEVLIVCCVPARATSSAARTFIPVRDPITVSAPITYSTPQPPLIRPINKQLEICLNSPLKENAVKVMKTGRKAWDKCIDLADSVYPCVPAGFTINTRFARDFQCSHTAVPLINGGVDTMYGEFPHMASLGFASHAFPSVIWKCGGVLISDQWVLTAANCLSLGSGRSVTNVRLGGVDDNEPPQEDYIFTVIAQVPHPDYKPPAKFNDIALIKLDKKVTFSRHVRPACLHAGEEINDALGILTAWGSTQLEGKDSYNLLKTTVEKFSSSECSKTNPPNRSLFRNGLQNATQICYGQRTPQQNICKGDCGGVLQIYNNDRVQCTYLVFGIASNGNICGEANKPAAFTRVSAYISWIEDTVWPDSENA